MPAGNQPKTGHDCILYYNNGTVATPVWVEIDEVGDVSIADLNISEAEIKTRSSRWIKNLPSMFSSGIEFSYLYKANYTVFDALRGFFFAMDIRQYAIFDGDIAGPEAEGLVVPAFLSDFPIGQPLEEASMVDTGRLSIAYMIDELDAVVEPEWLQVA